MKIQLFRVTLVALVFLGLAGCAGEPTVLPATPHAAVTLDKVAIYPKRPGTYEQLGTIKLEITPEMKWDEKGDTNLAFDTMRQKAGALGANGILLWAPEGEYDAKATAGYNGTFYMVPVKRELPKRFAVVQAIYVAP